MTKDKVAEILSQLPNDCCLCFEDEHGNPLYTKQIIGFDDSTHIAVVLTRTKPTEDKENKL